MISYDGLYWVQSPEINIGGTGFNGTFNSGAAGNGLIGAINWTDPAHATISLYKSIDGLNWTSINWAGENLPNGDYGLFFAGGYFFILGNFGTICYSTPDLVTLTEFSMPAIGSIPGAISSLDQAMAYGNGKYVIVTRMTALYSSSPNSGWTAADVSRVTGWNSTSLQGPFSVVFANSMFVAVGGATNTNCMYSLDGITWYPGNPCTGFVASGLTYGNGYFLTGGSNTIQSVFYSVDGINWYATSGIYAYSVPPALDYVIYTTSNGSNLYVSLEGASTTGGTYNYQLGVVATTSPPVAGIMSPSRLSGLPPLTVQFVSASTGAPTSWSWTFGDGGTSTLANPSYTYTTAGTYDVSLTVANAYGSNSITKTAFISVLAPTLVTLTFEGIGATAGYSDILEYYNGGTDDASETGVNYGISFSTGSLGVIANDDPSGYGVQDITGEPSPYTVMMLYDGSGYGDWTSTMTVTAGFQTSISFYYSSGAACSVKIYDASNTLLASGSYAANVAMYSPFSVWTHETISFTGIAAYATFEGTSLSTCFDDISLTIL